jgi:uncharacterized membrane protein
MVYESLKAVHVLSIVLWVGGMMFSHFFLRPAAAKLEPPIRLTLMRDVLGRFFQAVLVASSLTLISGVWMLGRVAKNTVQSGGGFQMPFDWIVMTVVGLAMVAIFLHIRFALYKRLDRFVNATDWVSAGGALAQIRKWVFVNLLLGILILLIVLLA